MGDNISGINYLNNIELLPISSNLSLRSKREILDRLLIDYVVASIATYAFCSSYNLIKTFLTTFDSKFDISKIINGKDKELIINIYNNRINSDSLREITYRFESANTCMWVLGLCDNISYNEKCSVKSINELLLGVSSYNELLDKCNIRSINEILKHYSIISKVTYSNNNVDSIIDNIINNQDNAIRYIVLYNFNKNGLKVRYSNDKLKFEFELPQELRFVNVSSDILFALKGSNNIKVLCQAINENIQNNIKALLNSGFEVLDVKYVRSLYFEKRIVMVSIKKSDVLVNSYYVDIKGHIIRIDFSVTKVNIEKDIIYTLKVFE